MSTAPLVIRTDLRRRLSGRLRALRESRRLSIPEAAERAGVSEIYWRKLEGGERWPSDATLEGIAAGFGLRAKTPL